MDRFVGQQRKTVYASKHGYARDKHIGCCDQLNLDSWMTLAKALIWSKTGPSFVSYPGKEEVTRSWRSSTENVAETTGTKRKAQKAPVLSRELSTRDAYSVRLWMLARRASEIAKKL